MARIYGPIGFSDWRTMRDIHFEIKSCREINTDGKYDLAISDYTRLLKDSYKDIWEKAA